MRHITDDELYLFTRENDTYVCMMETEVSSSSSSFSSSNVFVCALNFWHFFIFGFKERRKGSQRGVCFKRYR